MRARLVRRVAVDRHIYSRAAVKSARRTGFKAPKPAFHRSHERLRELSPPEAFEAHNRANLIWTKGLATELRRLDPDAQFDVQTFFEALGRLPDVLSQSWLDLGPDSRALLLAASCEAPGPF